eukprot:c7070_g1_i1.p1 GENE.c7070_g1_i1~~c7070_g1_i1.p1  ORF type:complete len:109 (-),score=25.95 c7070_g1_i1:163-489(-)
MMSARTHLEFGPRDHNARSINEKERKGKDMNGSDNHTALSIGRFVLCPGVVGLLGTTTRGFGRCPQAFFAPMYSKRLALMLRLVLTRTLFENTTKMSCWVWLFCVLQF